MKKINLYCLPHAGGSAVIFKEWQNILSPHINVIAPELAGRGKRIGEPLYQNLQDAVNDIVRLIDLREPFAILGHSMGAMLAFEVARYLQLQSNPMPKYLFLVGRGAPQIMAPQDKIYNHLDDDAFKQKLIELGGTPKEFFEESQLYHFFLPLLRNDFKLAEHYFPNRAIISLNTRITVMVGKDEDISDERIVAWRSHAKSSKVQYFDGGHFFIHDQYLKVCDFIINELC